MNHGQATTLPSSTVIVRLSPPNPGPGGSPRSRTSGSPSHIDIMDRYAEFYKLYRRHFGHRHSAYLKRAQEWLQSLQEGDEHYACEQCANSNHWQCDRNALRCKSCGARHIGCSRTGHFKKMTIMRVMKISDSEYEELASHVPLKRKRKVIQAVLQSDSEDSKQRVVISEDGGPSVGNSKLLAGSIQDSQRERYSLPFTRLPRSRNTRPLTKFGFLDQDEQAVGGETLQVVLRAFRASLNSLQTALDALESVKAQEAEESSRCEVGVQHDISSVGQETSINGRTSAFTVMQSDVFWDTLLSDDKGAAKKDVT